MRFSQRISVGFVPAVLLAILVSGTASFGQPAGRLELAQGLLSPGAEASEKPVVVRAEFAPATEARPARLFVTATMKPRWYVYSLTQGPGGPVRSSITLEESGAFRLLDGFRPSPPPEKKIEAVFGDLPVETHAGTVTWYAPIELSPGTDPATLRIAGRLRAQPCDGDICLPPQNFPFEASAGSGVEVTESDVPAVGPGAPTGPPAERAPPSAAPPGLPDRGDGRFPWRPYTTFEAFRQLLGPSFDPAKLQANVGREFGGYGLAWIVVLGLAGGLLLNLMPCVLPVVGLRLFSFIKQSREHRARTFLLNVSFSAGLMSFFLVLATLAVTLNLGWGGLFTYAGFNVALAAVVFVMALGFLGVWEIPIPGFLGRGKAVELSQREGLLGAFAMGIITTIIATPCTGPFMGTALAWALRQPPLHTYAVFAAVGLGMASPYLLIGAVPELIRFLPKPGEWMETFKHVMGFVLLGTVVYVLTFIWWPYVVPTVGLLVALGVACWWIGRQPVGQEWPRRLRTWAGTAAFVGLAWLVLFPGIDGIIPGPLAFRGLYRSMEARHRSLLDRENALYLERLRGEGYELVQTGRPSEPLPTGPHTVLAFFTADWCSVCKTLEAQVLDTPEVRDMVERTGAVAVKADWTNQEAEVTKLMDLLGAGGVPVVAVFPADDPNVPTAVFRGGLASQREILDAIRRGALAP